METRAGSNRKPRVRAAFDPPSALCPLPSALEYLHIINMENNISDSNSTAKKSKPLGQIKVYRRFYSPTDSLYFAWRYVENHQTSLGDVPNAVLEVFRHFYAPLGMQEFGNPNEVVQSTVRAISFLEGHLRYLKALYESVQNAQSIPRNPPQFLSSPIPNQNNGYSPIPNQSNGHSSSLSAEELQTMEMYKMFES